MSYSPGPRQGILPRSLYLPSSFYEDTVGESVHQPDSNRSFTASYESHPNANTFPSSSTTITTPVFPQSHFSPSSLEQGFEKYPHEDKDMAYGSSKDSSPDAQCQCKRCRRSLTHNLLICTLVVLILVLIANAIFLDVHMVLHPSNLLDRAAAKNLKDISSNHDSNVSASPSSSLLSSLSPTPSPTTLPSPSPNPNDNLLIPPASDIPSQAVTCIAQFLPNATPPQAAAVYCAQCLPALQNIPLNWFVEESNGGTQGGANLQALSNALGFCTNSGLRLPR